MTFWNQKLTWTYAHYLEFAIPDDFNHSFTLNFSTQNHDMCHNMFIKINPNLIEIAVPCRLPMGLLHRK